MKALTLQQPWLYAIEHLGKRVENRTWKIPLRLRGQWIALHAGLVNESEQWRIAEAIHGEAIPSNVPFGAVTSVTKFDRSIVTLNERHASMSKWLFGPYGWLITDLFILEEPLPYPGMLKFWTVPAKIEEKIMRQLLRRQNAD